MWYEQVAKVLLLIVLMGFGTQKGIDFLKHISYLLAPKFPWAKIEDSKSMIFAGALVTAGIFFFDLNLLAQIEGLGLEILDPDLAKFILSMLTLFTANKVHDKYG